MPQRHHFAYPISTPYASIADYQRSHTAEWLNAFVVLDTGAARKRRRRVNKTLADELAKYLDIVLTIPPGTAISNKQLAQALGVPERRVKTLRKHLGEYCLAHTDQRGNESVTIYAPPPPADTIANAFFQELKSLVPEVWRNLPSLKVSRFREKLDLLLDIYEAVLPEKAPNIGFGTLYQRDPRDKVEAAFRQILISRALPFEELALQVGLFFGHTPQFATDLDADKQLSYFLSNYGDNLAAIIEEYWYTEGLKYGAFRRAIWEGEREVQIEMVNRFKERVLEEAAIEQGAKPSLPKPLTFYAECSGITSGCPQCGRDTSAISYDYCSKECALTFKSNHHLQTAKAYAFASGHRRCADCGRCAEPGVKLQVDHVVPLVSSSNRSAHQWGCLNHQSNLQLLCQDCHQRKTSQERKERKAEKRDWRREMLESFDDLDDDTEKNLPRAS